MPKQSSERLNNTATYSMPQETYKITITTEILRSTSSTFVTTIQTIQKNSQSPVTFEALKQITRLNIFNYFLDV